jgi:hypothetical protein
MSLVAPLPATSGKGVALSEAEGPGEGPRNPATHEQVGKCRGKPPSRSSPSTALPICKRHSEAASPRYAEGDQETEMSETRPAPGITIQPEDYDLVLDAIRFARDEFFDDNGLPWSNDEYSRLQDIIDTIEPLIVPDSIER